MLLPTKPWLAAVSVAALSLAAAPSVEAHTDPPEALPPPAVGSGSAHAAEHAALEGMARKADLRWEALSSHERRAESRRQRRAARRLARRTAGDSHRVGKWTEAPFALPNYAIHTMLLPTGKVLMLGYPPLGDDYLRDNFGRATLWDPSQGFGEDAFVEIDPPLVDPDGDGPQAAVPAPVYCSGQTLLPDGRALMTGGNLVWPARDPDDAYTAEAGTDLTFTFDPWTETWAEGPQMADGRWYPSQLGLADGTTLILGGYTDDEPGGVLGDDLEIFDPAQGDALSHPATADRATQLYPHLFLLPDADTLLAGPGLGDSARLNTGAPGGGLSWTELGPPSGPRFGGSAVLRPGPPSGSWQVTEIGGYGLTPPQDGAFAAASSTETIDASEEEQAGWTPDMPLRVERSYHNTVLLPDRSMVTVGGGIGYTPEDRNYAVDPEGSTRRVELFDPDAGHWRLGPAQMEDRAYHSTALLLPNGRVWSAGDDLHGPDPFGGYSSRDTGEIYSPPYLFDGERPRIAAAPSDISWNESFEVRYRRRRPALSGAVLVAPGATTHGNDMQQRVVDLAIEGQGSRSLTLTAPPSPGVAPPGYYMLFGLSADGVPSVASWLRVGPAGA